MSRANFDDLGELTCCLIPMYNEAKVIGSVVSGLREVFTHVLCVDDGSTDDSAIQARHAGAVIVQHALNIGQGGAIATGFSIVESLGRFKYIVTFDADGQHDPSDALALVRHLHNNHLDVVFASRFLSGREQNVPWTKKVMLKLVTRVTKALTNADLSDAHNGLRALTVDAARKIQLTQYGMAHASQFVSLVLQNGLTYAEIPATVRYTPYSRSKGQPIINSVNIVLDLLWG